LSGQTEVHHIGVAVASIEEQRPFYEDILGARFEGTEIIPEQKVKIGFFRFANLRVELLEPTDPSGPVARFMEKRGAGLHHVAYSVEDLPARIAELKKKGIQMVDEVPKAGSHGSRIAFLHPRSSGGVLTELCEPGKD
jgi:methylmalonyl-CoA/ethylmalonyl-CoA epimerase